MKYPGHTKFIYKDQRTDLSGDSLIGRITARIGDLKFFTRQLHISHPHHTRGIILSFAHLTIRLMHLYLSSRYASDKEKYTLLNEERIKFLLAAMEQEDRRNQDTS